MQQTSELYREILQDDHHFEHSLVLGEDGVMVDETGDVILFGEDSVSIGQGGPDSGFGEDDVQSISTTGDLFPNGIPEIGKAISREIDVTMLRPFGDIPRMSLVAPYTRAVSDVPQSDGSTLTSEWLPKGRFYIDTREETANDDDLNLLTIHGYDAMMRAEAPYASTALDWPALDTEIVAEIAGFMDVSVDPRTWAVMTDENELSLPTGYTQREILGYIAGMYAGSFYITDLGELRLYSFSELPPELNLMVDENGDAIQFGDDCVVLQVTAEE